MATTIEIPVAGADKTNKIAHSAVDIGNDVDNISKDQEHGIHQQAGISKVEASNKALHSSGPSGQILLYVLAVSLGLTMFAHHAELGAVNTATAIIRAISKPFLGKLSDITSRPTTYVVVLVVYAVGFAVAASSQTIESAQKK